MEWWLGVRAGGKEESRFRGVIGWMGEKTERGRRREGGRA